jgi:hypothetical protein
MDKISLLHYIVCTNRIRAHLWVTEKWRVHCTLDEVQLSNCAKMQFPLKKMIAFDLAIHNALPR